jgi:CO/xanthine dehydrogenase FAD-binding subunit
MTKEYFLPKTVEEATALLAEYGPAMLVMAGGTLAMPLINEGVSMPEYVLGLRRTNLKGFHRENGNFVLGAITSMSDMVKQSDLLFLRQAAQAIGGWSIRNMATVGGNLFAPPPAGDFAVALLALDAQLRLVSHQHIRSISLEEFFLGFMTTALEPGELLAEISFAVPKGKTAYLKFGRRHANTPAIVTVAAHVVQEAGKVTDVRMALNGVGDFPLRAKGAEAVLLGKPLDRGHIKAAAEIASQECQPFTDPIASEWYRRKMVDVYVRRALEMISG